MLAKSEAEFQAQIVRFAAGFWQRGVPSKPGWYRTATQDGLEGSEIPVKARSDGQTYLLDEWDGWIWSEPTPRPPAPPAWGTDG